jgi:hypothetical protein
MTAYCRAISVDRHLIRPLHELHTYRGGGRR